MMVPCADCRFFLVNPKHPAGGKCRKNPPVVIQASTDCGPSGYKFDLETVWPWVSVEDSCGEGTSE